MASLIITYYSRRSLSGLLCALSPSTPTSSSCRRTNSYPHAGLRRRREAVHLPRLAYRGLRLRLLQFGQLQVSNSGSNSESGGSGSPPPPPPPPGKPKSCKLKETTEAAKREPVVRLRHISRVMRGLVLGDGNTHL
ncbi:hypothetical protein C8J57DRAFT_1526890 [Mycena rebaudengoi]|nr:hypothetical protein C8J57DRAFT_1547756 [Mycena rebaudengoi]KAJ7241425.1 hypothetical protein C8J57DRAFT_1526890 [Mycena rebaudengoi]